MEIIIIYTLLWEIHQSCFFFYGKTFSRRRNNEWMKKRWIYSIFEACNLANFPVSPLKVKMIMWKVLYLNLKKLTSDFIFSMEKNWDFVWKFRCSFIINLGWDESAAAELGNNIKLDLYSNVMLSRTFPPCVSWSPVFCINLMIWGGQWETNPGSVETLTIPSAG